MPVPVGAVPQLEEPGRWGGANAWNSQWFAVRRGGVAWQGSLAGCVGLPELGKPDLGSGTARVGDGGTVEQ